MSRGKNMEDELRTFIQDFLITTCGVDETISEAIAEGFGDYLNERGYRIIDATAGGPRDA